MSKHQDIIDLVMDMQMLEMDYEYCMELAHSTSDYDYRIERFSQAIEIFNNLLYYEELIIKRKHC